MNEKLRQLFAEILELRPAAISDTTTSDEVPTWDSLNHLKLITAFEEAFNIRLTMDEVSSFRAIADFQHALELKGLDRA
jgi:acyl carrier protein